MPEPSQFNSVQRSQEAEQPPTEGPSSGQSNPLKRPLPVEEHVPDFRNLIAGLESSYNRHSHERELLKDRIKVMEEEWAKLIPVSEERDRLNSRVLSLQQRVKALEDENKEVVLMASPMHKHSPNNSKKGVWAPKDGEWIRHKFSKLAYRIHKFSIKHGLQSLSKCTISKRDKDEMIKDLQNNGYCSEDTWDSLMKKSTNFAQSIPRLVLQARIAKEIFTNISRPFFPFARAFSSSNPFPQPSPGELDFIHQEMMAVNPVEAHTWRSDTLRKLFPAITKNVNYFAVRKISDCYPIGLFNSNSWGVLEHDELIADMKAIQTKAVHLALSLWTQREYFKPFSQKELPFFESSNNSMTTYGVPNTLVSSLNGSQVLLCLQPAIIAYGDENAENYDVSKVWAEAVMLVDETGVNEPEGPNRNDTDEVKVEIDG